jgi:hypothetical protein
VTLFGERGFPELQDEHCQALDPSSLRLTPQTRGLIADWLSLMERDVESEHDATLLAGVRAGAAIARELRWKVPVQLAMRDPFVQGAWLSLDFGDPSVPNSASDSTHEIR